MIDYMAQQRQFTVLTKLGIAPVNAPRSMWRTKVEKPVQHCSSPLSLEAIQHIFIAKTTTNHELCNAQTSFPYYFPCEWSYICLSHEGIEQITKRKQLKDQCQWCLAVEAWLWPTLFIASCSVGLPYPLTLTHQLTNAEHHIVWSSKPHAYQENISMECPLPKPLRQMIIINVYYDEYYMAGNEQNKQQIFHNCRIHINNIHTFIKKMLKSKYSWQWLSLFCLRHTVAPTWSVV